MAKPLLLVVAVVFSVVFSSPNDIARACCKSGSMSCSSGCSSFFGGIVVVVAVNEEEGLSMDATREKSKGCVLNVELLEKCRTNTFEVTYPQTMGRF